MVKNIAKVEVDVEIYTKLDVNEIIANNNMDGYKLAPIWGTVVWNQGALRVLEFYP